MRTAARAGVAPWPLQSRRLPSEARRARVGRAATTRRVSSTAHGHAEAPPTEACALGERRGLPSSENLPNWSGVHDMIRLRQRMSDVRRARRASATAAAVAPHAVHGDSGVHGRGSQAADTLIQRELGFAVGADQCNLCRTAALVRTGSRGAHTHSSTSPAPPRACTAVDPPPSDC
jgi:hypothetical protein